MVARTKSGINTLDDVPKVQKKYFNPAVNEKVNVVDKGGTFTDLGNPFDYRNPHR